MILENSKAADVLTTGTEESIDMSIDASDQGVLMMILSESLYKDPIGSMIREWTSNALDAHTEAGVTDPILVKVVYENNNWWFKVQDFGTGISPDRVTKILSKYAASTKRSSNAYLGAFGLGFKSGLAYSDSFTFSTRYNGIEYQYIMYKGEDGTKIDLISEKHTTERNGTIVQTQLKGWSDKTLFETKIKEQLCYFEGVFFECPTISNDFKILKGEGWKFSTLGVDKSMHLCLDNVYYPLDFKRLGITPINLPIGLDIKIGEGLIPIPSREDVKYTEDAKKMVLAKIEQVTDWFTKKYQETHTSVKTFQEYLKLMNDSVVTVEGIGFDVKSLGVTNSLKMEGITHIDLRNVVNNIHRLFQHYEFRGDMSNGRFFGKYEREGGDLANMVLIQTWNKEIIIAEERPKGVLLEYLRETHPNSLFLYKKRDRILGNKKDDVHHTAFTSSYFYLFDLRNVPKKEWRNHIREFEVIEKEVLDKCLRIENLQPTDQWLLERKARRAKAIRRYSNMDQITIKAGRESERAGHNMTFDSKIKQIKDVAKEPFLHIYGINKEKEYLDQFWPLQTVTHDASQNLKIRDSHLKIQFVLLNESEIKKIEDVHNFISIQDFMKGNTRPFKRFVTALVIGDLITKHDVIFNNSDYVGKLSTVYATKLDALQAYYGLNYNEHISDSLKKTLLDTAIAGNLWDTEIYSTYLEVQKTIHMFDFMNCLNIQGTTWSRMRSDYLPDARAVSVGIELLKARRFRMNWENYITLNTETTTVKEDSDEEGEEDEAILDEINDFVEEDTIDNV